MVKAGPGVLFLPKHVLAICWWSRVAQPQPGGQCWLLLGTALRPAGGQVCGSLCVPREISEAAPDVRRSTRTVAQWKHVFRCSPGRRPVTVQFFFRQPFQRYTNWIECLTSKICALKNPRIFNTFQIYKERKKCTHHPLSHHPHLSLPFLRMGKCPVDLQFYKFYSLYPGHSSFTVISKSFCLSSWSHHLGGLGSV